MLKLQAAVLVTQGRARPQPMTPNSPSQQEVHGPAPGSSAEAPSTDATQMLGRRIGNYVIERPLARGGMGSVFVARHPHLGKEVAVKFLDLEVSTRPELAQRFLAEARITANLNHPNIVDIFDFGEIDGRLYYVMELLRGKSLRAQMRAQGRFTLPELKHYLDQMCSALDAAHTAGVVHRDLKPGNVFVLDGDGPRVKLLDFGVAKLMATAEANTRHGQVLGTASHMAPEQALGDVHRITPQSDLYSLGVIAYEMLTGVPLFRHESDLMLMVMHVRDRITPIREVLPDVPAAVAAVIESCLAKAPQERPASARTLGAALSEAMARAPLERLELSLPRPPRDPAIIQLGSQATLPESAMGVHSTQADPGVDLRELGLGATLPSRDPVPAAVAAAPSPPIAAPAAPLIAPAPPSITLQNIAPAPATSPTWIAEPARIVEPVRPEPTRAPEPVRPIEPAQAAEAPRAEATPELPAPEPAPEEREDTPLTATATATLNKLLLRLQRKGDFPAFAQSVGEVSKKADADSAYSASQLGESILKDYALTAKLLKVVNSMYANRFGGKIYSVQHAIVLLGFDRIRSLALGISLFKGSGKQAPSPFVTDSAVSSLVSGEIARSLAWSAKLSDEEALVCAMFRNLGRHLVIVYLPEVFEQVTQLAERERLNERVAAERVLGITYSKLGVAVAQNWKLPPRMISAISARGTNPGALTRPEDRVSALAALSNDLCEVVASAPAASRERAISELLARHKQLMNVSEETILDLLANVQESFQQRYATLGLDVKASRFLNSVGALVEARATAAAEAEAAAAAARTEAEPLESAESLPAALGELPGRARQHVAKLNLAKELPAESAGIVLRPLAAIVHAGVEQRIDEVQSLVQSRAPADTVLTHALKLWAQHSAVSRLLLLVPNNTRDELVVRAGMRDDLEAVSKELRLPLRSARGPTNLFAATFQSGKDTNVPDAFAQRSSATVPVRYFEVLGSPAFALYGCLSKGVNPALLLADFDAAESIPPSDRVAPLARLRPLIAQAASTLR